MSYNNVIIICLNHLFLHSYYSVPSAHRPAVRAKQVELGAFREALRLPGSVSASAALSSSSAAVAGAAEDEEDEDDEITFN